MPVTAASVATAAAVKARTPILDGASYLGRHKDDVIEELEALGYIVVERNAGPTRGFDKNTVVGIEPAGILEPGTTVTILVAKEEE